MLLEGSSTHHIPLYPLSPSASPTWLMCTRSAGDKYHKRSSEHAGSIIEQITVLPQGPDAVLKGDGFKVKTPDSRNGIEQGSL
jgi:hypothetical protein